MKYHITEHGPRACQATKGRCPYAGENTHFNTVQEAQVAYERKLEKEFSNVASFSKHSQSKNSLTSSRLVNITEGHRIIQERKSRGTTERNSRFISKNSDYITPVSSNNPTSPRVITHFISPTGAPVGSDIYYEQAMEAGFYGVEDDGRAYNLNREESQ